MTVNELIGYLEEYKETVRGGGDHSALVHVNIAKKKSWVIDIDSVSVNGLTICLDVNEDLEFTP